MIVLSKLKVVRLRDWQMILQVMKVVPVQKLKRLIATLFMSERPGSAKGQEIAFSSGRRSRQFRCFYAPVTTRGLSLCCHYYVNNTSFPSALAKRIL